ncbi:MAG: hypothetical protein RL030_901, partial [Pseudomonadota bacterium]
SWARKQLKDNYTGAAPRKASDVLSVGDVVYVIPDRRGGAILSQLPDAQGALVALNPKDGAIVTMTGGFDFFNNRFNRVTQARRQPGSGFKPFIYSAALDEGFTPASVILDMPVVLEGGGEENWRPENSARDFAGPLRLREALVRSRNTVSIRILQTIGMDAAINHAVKFGFDKATIPRNYTLALGTLVASPLDMVTGFATFANGGFKVTPYYIDRIEDSLGKVVYQAEPELACLECEDRPAMPPVAMPPVAAPSLADAGEPGSAPPLLPPEEPPAPRFFDADAPDKLRQLAQLQGGRGFLPAKRLAPRVLSPQNAWLMTDIMKDVVLRGTAVRARSLGRTDLAGKTGTSNDERDAWFNGFNGQLVATVWMGFDEERPLGRGEDGAGAAVPVWMSFMREALRNVPANSMARPSGLIDLKISPYTGTLADPSDPEAIYETFMLEHQPRVAEPGDPGYRPFGAGTDGSGGAEPLF